MGPKKCQRSVSSSDEGGVSVKCVQIYEIQNRLRETDVSECQGVPRTRRSNFVYHLG